LTFRARRENTISTENTRATPEGTFYLLNLYPRARIFNINKCIKPLFIKRTHVSRFAFSISPGIDCRRPSAALCLREFSTARWRRRVTERGDNPFYIVVDAEEYTTNRGEDFMEQVGAGDFFTDTNIAHPQKSKYRQFTSHLCVQ